MTTLLFLFLHWLKNMNCPYDTYIGVGTIALDLIGILLTQIWFNLSEMNKKRSIISQAEKK